MKSTTRTTSLPKKRQRQGAVSVEFAVTAPLLFLFLFAAIEVGLANMMFHTTEAAAYEGARIAIVPGANPTEVETEVRRILSTANIQVAQVNISPSNLSSPTDTVTVTVSVDFADNSTLIPKFFFGGQPFVRRCELNREKL